MAFSGVSQNRVLMDIKSRLSQLLVYMSLCYTALTKNRSGEHGKLQAQATTKGRAFLETQFPSEA